MNEKVDIRPKVGYLAVLPRINYRPWYAIAEFVDNSVQSYLANKKILNKLHKNFVCKINIEVTSSMIKIYDNAAGISQKDYQRAFRAAAPPENTGGLSEFGMGMKTAACWFANKWQVKTKPLGEKEVKIVKFDIEKIVRDSMEELDVTTSKDSQSKHYTEILLTSIIKKRKPQGGTVAKIKDCLASMYRILIENEELEIKYNGRKLNYKYPKILKAFNYKDIEENKKNIKEIIWKKNINFKFGKNNEFGVKGFVALREDFNRRFAGLSIFRRDRLIIGMEDETYRPPKICGTPETRRYARVFGELIFSKNMPVTHTKDNIEWSLEEEDKFLSLLKNHIDSDAFPLLRQANKYKVDRSTTNDLKIATDTGHKNAVSDLSEAIDILVKTETPKNLQTPEKLPPSSSKVQKISRTAIFDNEKWKINSELDPNPLQEDWLSISNKGIKDKEITIRIALNHSFTNQFFGDTPEEIEGMIRLANYICLSEIVSVRRGNPKASQIRMYLNSILREQPPPEK